MRDGDQLEDFSAVVSAALDLVKSHLPEDLTIIRASDQAQQAEENTELFSTALYEAVIMVVLVVLSVFVGGVPPCSCCWRSRRPWP
jgi:multidrug efflux pump subunit AcrB